MCGDYLRGGPRMGHRAATEDGSCNRTRDRAKGLVGARLYGEGMSSITRSIVGPEVSAGSLSQIATPFLDPRVTLGGDRVRALAATLRRGASESEYQPLLWDDDRFWLTIASPEERSQFMAVGNALNFRFWELADGDGVSPAGGRLDGEYLVGSMYMWRRLRLVLERDEFPLLDARQLARLEPDQLRALLADDEGGDPLAPGFDDRLANLRDLGAVLSRDWDGQFSNLLAVADDDLETFFALSATARAYDDPLRKLSTVNAIMLSGSGLAPVPSDHSARDRLPRCQATAKDWRCPSGPTRRSRPQHAEVAGPGCRHGHQSSKPDSTGAGVRLGRPTRGHSRQRSLVEPPCMRRTHAKLFGMSALDRVRTARRHSTPP